MADLDHRYVTPPYLRITSHGGGTGGDAVYLWDLRIAQPNATSVPTPSIHSLEHFLNRYFRESTTYTGDERVFLAAPMGCQTGFYIVSIGIADYVEMSGMLAEALESVAEATAVPLANPVQCGWAEHHSLSGAKELAAWLLRRRPEWHDAGRAVRERD
jgi:S-ribosylhomocysteine lyase